MKKFTHWLTILPALALLFALAIPAMAETTDVADPELQEIINRLEQGNGHVPADFDYEDFTILFERGDPAIVDELMEKIIQNSPPVSEPESYLNEPRSTERSNVYTSYNYATKTKQELTFDNSDPNTVTLESKGSQIDTPAPEPDLLSRAYPDFWFERCPQSYYDTRTNVKLLVEKQDGHTYVSSGFLIDDRYLMTASHNLYSGDAEMYESVIVYPSRSEDYGNPYGYALATDAWLGNYSFTHIAGDDWAVVQLNKSFDIGYLGMMTNTSNEKGRNVRIQGYPGNIWPSGKPSDDENQAVNNNLYLATGPISKDVSAYQKHVNAENFKGMSGGPVMYRDSNNDWCSGGIIVQQQGAITIYCAFDNNLYNWILDIIYG